MREGLEVQRCPHGDGIETFILCRSADRASKEQAMRERFVARIVAGLRRIRAACRRRRCAVGAIERRVGRLLGQNPRAARLFRVQVDVAPDGGAYMSESNYFERNFQRSYWGNNYPRLAAIKKKYDPDGLFVIHNGVGSEEWSADGFTRV